MPRYKPTPEEDEMYSDQRQAVSPPGGEMEGAEPPAAGAPKEGEAKPKSVDEAEAQSDTAILPNKVLMEPGGSQPKEGDEIVVKVIKNYGDESEVAYAPKKPTTQTDMSTADDEIMALDEKGT